MSEIHLYSDIDGTLNESPFVELQNMVKIGKNADEIKRSPEFVMKLENASTSPFYKDRYVDLYAKASRVIYHSGRDLYHRSVSKKWLSKNGVYEESKCEIHLFPFTTRQDYLERKYKFLESAIHKNEKTEKKVKIIIFDDDPTIIEWVLDYINKIDAHHAEAHLIKDGKMV